MNYFKAALTGFGMSLINTALLGSRFGTYLSYSYELRTREDIYIKIILVNDNYLVNIIDPTLFNIDIDIERNGLDFSNFNYILYNRGVQCPNFWFETPMSIGHAFIFSSSTLIPASIVGAFVHENLSSSIINLYDLNVNEYLVTASIFGTIGMLKGLVEAKTTSYNMSDMTQPWIYSHIISEGFIMALTGVSASFFGEE